MCMCALLMHSFTFYLEVELHKFYLITTVDVIRSLTSFSAVRVSVITTTATAVSWHGHVSCAASHIIHWIISVGPWHGVICILVC